MADMNQVPIDPTAPPPVPEVHDLPPADPPVPMDPVPVWPPPTGADITPNPALRARARTVILAIVAALLLTTIGALAVVARQQASSKQTARRKLATASAQLNAASQELDRSSSALATTQFSLADAQARKQTEDDMLSQVRANEIDFIAPALVGPSINLDQARCIVNGVIDRLGIVAVLSYDHGPTAQMPADLSNAIDQAQASCA
jgi:hypothetical protein